MKRKILLLSTLVMGCAFATLATSKSLSKVSAATTLPTTYTTNWKAMGAQTLSTGKFSSDPQISYSANKNTANEDPTIYKSSGGDCFLNLKYDSKKGVGTLGAYIDFSCSDSYKFTSFSFAKVREINKCGYQIDVKDNASVGFTNVASVAKCTVNTGPSLQFSTVVQVIRIYHVGCGNTEYGPLRITDITFGIDASDSKTLSFDTNGGASIDSVSYTSSEVTSAPTTPTKPNNGTTKYIFEGWYTNKECTDGNEFEFGSALTVDTTIYAKWSETTISGHSLTFHTNSSHSIVPQTVEEGYSYQEPIVGELYDDKYDYTLTGWYADSSCATPFDFSQVYDADADAYAKYTYKQRAISGATIISMKDKILTYGANWTCKENSTYTYSEQTLQSSEVSASLVDSTFSFKRFVNGNYGICRAGSDKYDVYMKRSVVTWELNDYSKYIKTVRWDLKNTGYSYNTAYTVSLFTNKDCSGTAVDVDHLSLASNEADRCVQMTNNTDESINVVSFKQANQSFNYGFEKLHYILGEASAEQQVKNFAKAFLEQMTCSGDGSITADSSKWATIATRVGKMSSEAKLLLANYSGSDETVLAAIDRYDYIIGKYGTASYSNFLERTVSPISGANFPLNGLIDNTSNVMIIIIVSFLSVTALGSIIALKKKRHTN